MDNVLKIDEWLNNNKDSMISDTMELLKINSESYDREEVTKALDKALEIAKGLGFKTEKRAKGEVGVVFFGEGDETLGILAHVDVVPIGDEKAWTHSPYGEVFEEKIYGRGIVDNKGMVISSLYAMAAVKALKLPVYKKVELIIGTREEITWDDLEEYKKEGHTLPDYGFTPDGEFPIINREKGNVELNLKFADEKCEGDFEVIEFKSGEAVNSIPDFAFVKIKGNFDLIEKKVLEYNSHADKKLSIAKEAEDVFLITAQGKASHSSLPELGDNALVTLCDFLRNINFNHKGIKSLIKFACDNFNNNYYGEKLGLPKHKNEINGEELGRTTIAPTMLYKDNEYNLFLSIRSVYGTKKDEIINFFNKLSSFYSYTYIVTDYLEPLYVPKEHKFIKILENSYEEVTHLKADFILAGGTTYAKAMPNTVAFGPIFPNDQDNSHQKDEFILINKFMEATKIYSLVISEVLVNEDSLR